MRSVARIGLLLGLAFLLSCSSTPKRSATLDVRNRAAGYAATGRSYFRSARYEIALEWFLRSRGLYESIDFRPGVARVLCSIGRTHLELGLDLEALGAFQQAREVAEGLGSELLQAEAIGNAAQWHLRAGEVGTAVQLLEEALALPLPPDSPERAVLLHDLGLALGRQERIEDGLERMGEALAIQTALGNRRGQAADLHGLAVLLSRSGDQDAALAKGLEALALDKRLENRTGIAADLELLGEIQEQAGDRTAALDFFGRARSAWAALDQTARAERLQQRLDQLK